MKVATDHKDAVGVLCGRVRSRNAALVRARRIDVPLLGETIGANLERDRRARARRATRWCPATRTCAGPTPSSTTQVDRAGARRCWRRRLRAGRPGRASGARTAPSGCCVQYATAKVGVDPRQHQPRLPDLRARVRAPPVGLPGAGRRARRSRRSTTRRWSTEVAPELPRPRARRVPRARPTGTSCSPAPAPSTTDAARRATARSTSTTRSTSSTRAARPASPRAPRSPTTTSSTTASSSARRCRYTEADRVCIPVPFYHCFGMVLGNLACTTHGACMVVPGAGVRARARCSRRCRPSAARRSTACRRCSSPSSTTRDFGDVRPVSSLRTGIMAGSPCPVEVMRKVVDRMHMDEVTICYGMTETSPVSTQTARRRRARAAASAPSAACTRTSRSRSSTPRPARTVAARRARRAAARAATRVMLGYWDDPERTAEAIDAAGWMHTGDLATMDDDGYVNIVGRIKDMIIRGGENVYPREIEEFLYTPPRRRRRPGDRRARRALRRGDHGLGASCARAPTLDEDALREFCRGKIAHYKVPRYVRVRRRVPDDGHRQGPEVQDARGGGRGAGPEGGRDGLAAGAARSCTPRALVLAPAQELRPVPDAVARDVVEGDLADQLGAQPLPDELLVRLPALTARPGRARRCGRARAGRAARASAWP